MKEDKLIKYLRVNKNYSFRLGNFLIPKGITTIKENYHDLEQSRGDNLAQGSAWSPDFQKFLDTKHKSIDYIREFPIIIRDQTLWGSMCELHNVPPNLQSRNYFLADYLIYNYNFMVEIDSQYHNEEYDNARDEYIKRGYGLDTLRFYEYGRNKYQKFSDDFQFLVNLCRNSGAIPVDFNYDQLIIDNFLQSNSKVISVYDKIENLLATRKLKTVVLNSKNLSIPEFVQLRYGVNYLEELINYFRFSYNVNVILVT